MLGLNPEYELYLRQHDGGIIETVLYALPLGGNAQRGKKGEMTDYSHAPWVDPR